MRGDSTSSCGRIAACWANNRNAPQIAFKPDWARHAEVALFKRNDRTLEAVPISIHYTSCH
jgi:hypothetical protein